MELILIGASYRNCPLEVREALIPAHLEPALVRLKASVREAVVLSTCHRLEVYGVLAAPGSVETLLSALNGARPEALSRLYQLRGEAVVRHALRVSSGLDSLIPGEAQVLGQVRQAADRARQWGLAGPVLSALFRTAITCGKRVRSSTRLMGRWATLGTAAAELARRSLGELKGRSALLLGAGKTTEMAALALRQGGIGGMWLSSRTLSRAQAVAGRLGAQPIPFEGIGEVLRGCHLMVSATTAPHSIVSRPLVEQAVAGRDFPLVIIDLALPRDVEPSVAELPGVSLFNVDQLPELSAEPPSPEDIARAEALVDEETERFSRWLREREAVPAVIALYRRAERIRLEELRRALPRLSSLSFEQWGAVQAMTRAIVNKLLHQPVTRSKEAAAQGDGALSLKLMRELFDLKDEGQADDQAQQESPPV